jgi:hypothetical protein
VHIAASLGKEQAAWKEMEHELVQHTHAAAVKAQKAAGLAAAKAAEEKLEMEKIVAAILLAYTVQLEVAALNVTGTMGEKEKEIERGR